MTCHPPKSAVVDGFLLAFGYTKLYAGNLLISQGLRDSQGLIERRKVIRAGNLLILPRRASSRFRVTISFHVVTPYNLHFKPRSFISFAKSGSRTFLQKIDALMHRAVRAVEAGGAK